VQRAGIDAAEVEDVIMGCANPEGATGANIARQIALMADLPDHRVRHDRQPLLLQSGLQTIALAAQRIIAGEGEVYVAGGVESISCVQQEMNSTCCRPGWRKNKPEIYWNMLQTAEQVAKRYGIGRDAMDEYGAASQQKACAAQAAGKFDDEIAPITVTAGVADAVMGLRTKEVTVSKDEGLREGTTKEGISGIKPAMPGGVIAAGNASQFSDGAGACVVMSESLAAAHRASSRWAASSALRWPAASRTRWASARCSPCPRC
jgi:acetyl-CoA C-acetyltransferase